MFSNNSIILKGDDDNIIFYQTLLKKAVLEEAKSLTLLGQYISDGITDESILVKAKDVTGFSLSDCLLNNPSGIVYDSDTPLTSFEAKDFIDLLYSLDLFVRDDHYLEKYGKKLNLFDTEHTGNFHQQIGSFLLSLRKDPEMWWIDQKFEEKKACSEFPLWWFFELSSE